MQGKRAHTQWRKSEQRGGYPSFHMRKDGSPAPVWPAPEEPRAR